jgi:transposase
MASLTPPAAAPRAVFPPAVAIHVVRLACERPDLLGRSLSPGDGAELARQLIADGLVVEISAATIRRLLVAPQLNPWRHHRWRLPPQPRAADFSGTVSALIALSTRPLRDDEMVLLAAFDTRAGRVYGQCDERKRQQECIAFLEYWD